MTAKSGPNERGWRRVGADHEQQWRQHQPAIAGPGGVAEQRAREHRHEPAFMPDLVVLDIRMPPTFTGEGARAARSLKRTHPALGVLVLSQHVETTHVAELITEGGFGYLLKDRVLDVADFLAAADRVARGGSALDPQVVARLLGSHGPLATLSERERTVLEHMAQGLTNTGIAKRLQLSERTVEAHVRHLLMKLDLPSDEDGHRRVLAVLALLNATL